MISSRSAGTARVRTTSATPSTNPGGGSLGARAAGQAVHAGGACLVATPPGRGSARLLARPRQDGAKKIPPAVARRCTLLLLTSQGTPTVSQAKHLGFPALVV